MTVSVPGWAARGNRNASGRVDWTEPTSGRDRVQLLRRPGMTRRPDRAGSDRRPRIRGTTASRASGHGGRGTHSAPAHTRLQEPLARTGEDEPGRSRPHRAFKSRSERFFIPMIDQLPPDAIYVAGVALVATLVAARLYAPGDWFSEESRFWAPVRRLAVPLLHRVFTNADDELYAETDVGKDEHVATLEDVTVDDVLDDLAAAGYQPQPLASFATDWADRPEAASWALYRGSRLYPGAPEWLRRRQVHVRLFEVPTTASGGPAVIVTAHEEPTSWRPDLWRAHYSGRDVDVERGVRMAAKDLDIESAPKRTQDHE